MSRKNSLSRSKSRRRLSSSITLSEHEEQILLEIINLSNSSDWKLRIKSLDKIHEFVSEHPEATSAKVISIFEKVNERLKDNNKKVNLHAIKTANSLIPITKDVLPIVLKHFVLLLANNIASSEAIFQRETATALSTLSKYISIKLLCPVFCHAAKYGNIKCQTVMLEKLRSEIKNIYIDYNSLISKHVLPLAFGLMNSKKPLIRSANEKLLLKLYEVLGVSIFDLSITNKLKISQLDKLKSILNKEKMYRRTKRIK